MFVLICLCLVLMRVFVWLFVCFCLVLFFRCLVQPRNPPRPPNGVVLHLCKLFPRNLSGLRKVPIPKRSPRPSAHTFESALLTLWRATLSGIHVSSWVWDLCWTGARRRTSHWSVSTTLFVFRRAIPKLLFGMFQCALHRALFLDTSRSHAKIPTGPALTKPTSATLPPSPKMTCLTLSAFPASKFGIGHMGRLTTCCAAPSNPTLGCGSTW